MHEQLQPPPLFHQVTCPIEKVLCSLANIENTCKYKYFLLQSSMSKQHEVEEEKYNVLLNSKALEHEL